MAHAPGRPTNQQRVRRLLETMSEPRGVRLSHAREVLGPGCDTAILTMLDHGYADLCRFEQPDDPYGKTVWLKLREHDEATDDNF